METYNEAEQLFLKQLSLDRIFAFISRTDYFLLSQILSASERSTKKDGIYLSELAEYWNISISDVSRIVKRLEDKGWVLWNIDENKTRTWLCISEEGLKRMKKQKKAMISAFERIKSCIPEGNLITTKKTVHDIQELIESQEIFI